MRTLLASLLISTLVASSASRTAQYPDKMDYKGKTYRLLTNPMEPYFEKHPEKRPKAEVGSSALWRGYVATFEVKDELLVLKDLEIEVWTKAKDGHRDTAWKTVKDELVPEGEVLAIDWFTGILVLAHGKRVNYVHMGYGSTYSHYILLEVRSGKISGEKNLDHRQYAKFREKQYQEYAKTEDYRKQVAYLKKEGWSQEEIDSFLRSAVIQYTSRFLDEEKPAKKPTERSVK